MATGFFGQIAKTNFDNPAGRYAGTSARGSASSAYDPYGGYPSSGGGLGGTGLANTGHPATSSTAGGLGTSLGEALGQPRTYTATGGPNGQYAQGPRVDAGALYNMYSAASAPQNAMDFAKLDANLKAMYGEAGAQKIQADIANQLRGVDAGLAQQLADIANAGYSSDEAGVARAIKANTDLLGLRNEGRDNAETYNTQQRDIIKAVLEQALATTQANRAEGTRVHDANIQKISGAFGSRGSYGSTARFASDNEQHGVLADLMTRARLADQGANTDYTSQSQGIDKAMKDLANSESIDYRQTWEKGAELNDRNGEIARARQQQAAQLAAAEQQRALQAQQQQAQIDAYYTQIQAATDAANAQKWFQTIQTNQAAAAAANAAAAQANAGKPTTHKDPTPARNLFR